MLLHHTVFLIKQGTNFIYVEKHSFFETIQTNIQTNIQYSEGIFLFAASDHFLRDTFDYIMRGLRSKRVYFYSFSVFSNVLKYTGI